MSKAKPLVGICVGHSRHVNGHPEGGAITHDGNWNEWRWNCAMAELISKELHARGVRSVVVSEYEGTGYGSAMRWLASHLKGLRVTVAVELHFNASDNPAANGHEWLYWHSSANARRLAESLDQEMAFHVPEIKARGIKPKTATDRGSEFLRGTHCPAVIAEPFFGSSVDDWHDAQASRVDIARAIAEGIVWTIWMDSPA